LPRNVYLLLGFTSIFSKNFISCFTSDFFVVKNGVQKYYVFFNVQVFFNLFLKNFSFKIACQKRSAKVLRYF